MTFIVNLYYRNNIVDAQAHTLRKKKGKNWQLDIDIDAAVDNTIRPDIITGAVRDAPTQALTAALQNHYDNPRPPQKGT